jgi:hypothetical protein
MIYNLDTMTITREWASQCDVYITDPPYSKHVHTNAVSQSEGGGTRERDFGFGYLTPRLRRHVGLVAASVKRWSVIYSDVESSTWLRISCEAAGAGYVRTIPWVRWSMPQMTGTMPPQGFEQLLCFYGKPRKGPDGKRRTGKDWNGPGSLTGLPHELPNDLDHTCLRGDTKHKAEKPLDQALDLISWFSRPGETVLDTFAGSGVFGLACALLGRTYVGFEFDPEWAARGQQREQIANLTEADLGRIKRWLETPDDSAMTPKSLERKALRDQDRLTLIGNL